MGTKIDTKLLDVKDATHYRNHLNAAAEALRRGELVAFPTETVYGLGANGQDTDAVMRLYDVKGRPRNKEFARIISGTEEIRGLIESMPLYARILAEEFWPGPLTIVFSSPGKNDIGIRFPRHKVAQDLIRMAGVPVIATSANISGKPPATDAQKALEYFRGRIGIILDGGPSTIKAPSTVVKVTQDSCTVLREGAVSKEEIMSCINVRIEVGQ